VGYNGRVQTNDDTQKRNVRVQACVLFALILLNFVAQIPYFVHLYLGRQAPAVTARSALIMGAVLAWFLLAAWLLFRGQRPGYLLMVAFLATEFAFYLFGLIQSAAHGYPPFFQAGNPDVVLRVIYSIGYMNLFASGCFLLLLLWRRSQFQGSAPAK
jgi:hypothetical protein